jgi:hypothetical protein
MLQGIRSEAFKKAWESLPFIDQLAWIYFIGNTVAILTLLEVLFLH